MTRISPAARAFTAFRCAVLFACVCACNDAHTPEPSGRGDERDGGDRAQDAGPDASRADASSGGVPRAGRSGSSGGSSAGSGATPMGAGSEGPPPDGSDCPEAAVNMLPEDLACTGLYADIAKKKLASGLRGFAPAHQLWSDGAQKQRWIYLPEGTQIDSSVSDDWQFPVGTKLFKEFSWDGHRVETRLFEKVNANLWLKAAYHWNEDETAATRFGGGEVDVAGHTYYIPSAKECDQCHKGRDDRALGFELISLGLAGAEGLNLQALVDEELLTDPPDETALEIGDDGTGHGAAALGWLHVNCGVSCHNDNSSAEGYSSDLRLRLPAEELDGSSSAEFEAIRTTIGVAAKTPRWSGRTRITPGSPEDSLVYMLASTRNAAAPKDQMPPIASRVVDADGIEVLEEWIRSLPTD